MYKEYKGCKIPNCKFDKVVKVDRGYMSCDELHNHFVTGDPLQNCNPLICFECILNYKHLNIYNEWVSLREKKLERIING